MDDSTRRGFLIMAGVGAAATAGVAAAATAGHRLADAGTTGAALPATAAGALVAYVRDVRSGRVSVMVGETEVVVHDPDLVAWLAVHAARKQA
jgi:hypothetical protein